MLGLSLSPVYNCAHVKADILKRSHGASLHRMQISWLVVHQDGLHAALEGALRGRERGLQEVAWRQTRGGKEEGSGSEGGLQQSKVATHRDRGLAGRHP